MWHLEAKPFIATLAAHLCGEKSLSHIVINVWQYVVVITPQSLSLAPEKGENGPFPLPMSRIFTRFPRTKTSPRENITIHILFYLHVTWWLTQHVFQAVSRKKRLLCFDISCHIQIQNTEFKQLYFVNISHIPLLHVIFYFLETDFNYLIP